MSAEVLTKWTCTRCGVVELVSGEQAPESWSQLRIAEPPSAAVPFMRADLCDDCASALESFLTAVHRIDGLDGDLWALATLSPFRFSEDGEPRYPVRRHLSMGVERSTFYSSHRLTLVPSCDVLRILGRVSEPDARFLSSYIDGIDASTLVAAA